MEYGYYQGGKVKPKNVMLLGFVNKAVDYLDKHIDQDVDSRLLKELRNIDLNALKDDLNRTEIIQKTK